MTKEEYLEKVKVLEANHETELNNLAKLFILKNKKFSVGDIVRRYDSTIIVDKIKIARFGDIPEPVYYGFQLKKDLTPRKDKSRSSVYGNDAELIINK